MSVSIIQADYEKLKDIAASFARQADLIAQVRQRMTHQAINLVTYSWKGRGAAEFAEEMDRTVLPALQRLVKAMTEGGKVIQSIAIVLREAEADAEKLFQGTEFVYNVGAVLSSMMDDLKWIELLADIQDTYKNIIKNIEAFIEKVKHWESKASEFFEVHTPAIKSVVDSIKKKLKLLSPMLKGVSSIIGLFDLQAAYVADGYKFGDNSKRLIGRSVGTLAEGVIKGAIGAEVGGFIGGAIGLLVPVPGAMLVGAAVGAGIGSFLGALSVGETGAEIGEEIMLKVDFGSLSPF